MLERIKNTNKITRIEYGLMVLFGTTCATVAFSPLEDNTRITLVALLFGLTVGLWLSHLVRMLNFAASSNYQ